MVRANRRKVVTIGGDAVVRGDWWVVSCWRSCALYIIYGYDLLGVELGDR